MLEKATTIEGLFHRHHHARRVYIREKELVHGTMLVHACETRWSSKTAMLESIVRNRVAIENALSCLRRERYDNATFRSMSWIWLGHIWDEFDNLLKILKPVQTFVSAIQAEDGTRGWALERFIDVRGPLEQVFIHASFIPF